MKSFGSVAPAYWEVDALRSSGTPPASGASAVGADLEGSARAFGVANEAPCPTASLNLRLSGNHILIVDDCTLYRDNLAAVMADNGAIVSAAWDLPTMITSLRETSLSFLLLNIATRDSATLLGAAVRINPNARVIVLAVSETDESVIVACAEAGVAGYHTRTQSFEDLLLLMGKVAAGESHCSPRVSAVLLRRLSALASEREPASKELVLTTREAQILEMLSLGLSNRDIADQLCIALHTVKNHVHSLLSKLGVSTRAEAAALSHGVRWTSEAQRN